MTFLSRLPAQSSPATGPGERLDRTIASPGRSGVTYDNLRVAVEASSRTVWCAMRSSARPICTLGLMEDGFCVHEDLARLCAGPGERPIDWFVMMSDTPGIFNLGGDLGHFAECIMAGNAEALRHYGQLAVRAVHKNTLAFGLPLVTLALVQGDALGGGFEHALSFDVLVAERSARLGLPEVLFNLFPGMGAYSFLSRKIGRAGAAELILSGRLRTAAELRAGGVVDVLAEDGGGAGAVREYISQRARRHNAHRALQQARRKVDPVTLQELMDVVDVWVEAAMGMSPADLKRMVRLTTAQNRRLSAMSGADGAGAARAWLEGGEAVAAGGSAR